MIKVFDVCSRFGTYTWFPTGKARVPRPFRRSAKLCRQTSSRGMVGGELPL